MCLCLDRLEEIQRDRFAHVMIACRIGCCDLPFGFTDESAYFKLGSYNPLAQRAT